MGQMKSIAALNVDGRRLVTTLRSELQAMLAEMRFGFDFARFRISLRMTDFFA